MAVPRYLAKPEFSLGLYLYFPSCLCAVSIWISHEPLRHTGLEWNAGFLLQLTFVVVLSVGSYSQPLRFLSLKCAGSPMTCPLPTCAHQ